MIDYGGPDMAANPPRSVERMRVLYATDGGHAAVGAGRLIEALADRQNVTVVVASVISTGLPELRHLSAALQSDETRRRIADEAVESARESLGIAGFDTEGLVRSGRSATTLIDIASQQRAQLIVAGSGTNWIGGRLLGSVSTDLVHCAPMSVLIVHEPPSAHITGVVVGVDGSEHANQALDVAMRFLDPQRCAVTVMCAAKLLAPALSPPYVGYATSAPSAEVADEILAPARENVEQAVKRLTDGGFDARAHVVLGHPVKRLVSEMDNLGAGLAVVGSRGLGALDRATVGSVSDQIVRHAPATLVGR